MSTALQRSEARPDQPRLRVPTPAKRIGYLIAAALNALMLWVAHQLLDWGWPGFLTDDFELVLGFATASFIANIVANLGLAVRYHGCAPPLADLVTAAFALAVGLRMWAVFPLDFTGYATDWSGWVRVALVTGIVASGIAIIVNLAKLITGSSALDRHGRGEP